MNTEKLGACVFNPLCVMHAVLSYTPAQAPFLKRSQVTAQSDNKRSYRCKSVECKTLLFDRAKGVKDNG